MTVTIQLYKDGVTTDYWYNYVINIADLNFDSNNDLLEDAIASLARDYSAKCQRVGFFSGEIEFPNKERAVEFLLKWS